MSPVVQTTIRLPEDLLERGKYACLRGKPNQTAAVITNVQLWLDGDDLRDGTSTAHTLIFPGMAIVGAPKSQSAARGVFRRIEISGSPTAFGPTSVGL